MSYEEERRLRAERDTANAESRSATRRLTEHRADEHWAEDAMCVYVEAIVASRARTCIEPVDPRSAPSDPRCARHLDERADR